MLDCTFFLTRVRIGHKWTCVRFRRQRQSGSHYSQKVKVVKCEDGAGSNLPCPFVFPNLCPWCSIAAMNRSEGACLRVRWEEVMQRKWLPVAHYMSFCTRAHVAGGTWPTWLLNVRTSSRPRLPHATAPGMLISDSPSRLSLPTSSIFARSKFYNKCLISIIFILSSKYKSVDSSHIIQKEENQWQEI